MKAKKRGEGEEEEEKKKKNKRSLPKVWIFGVWYGFLYGICKDPWFYIEYATKSSSTFFTSKGTSTIEESEGTFFFFH